MSQSTRILLSLVLGLLVGVALGRWVPTAGGPALAVAQPVGQAWLNALQMTIVPLVFSLLVTGVAATAEAAQAGRLAGRSVALYLAVMASSAIAAALLTPVFLAAAPIPAESAAALRSALSVEAPAPAPPVGEFLAAVIPANVLKAAGEGNFLAVIVFALAFAFAIMRIAPELRDLLVRVFTGLRDAMLVVIGWVLWAGPVGVFALALVVGVKAGGGAFQALLHYVGIVAGVGLVVSLAAYPVAVIGGRIPFARFVRGSLPTQAVAMSTQSSLATLPAMLENAVALGAPVATAGVTLPLAVAILRATGPAMNLAVGIYVASWFGVPLLPETLAVAALVAMLTSLGSVSLPGSVSFVGAISPVCATLGAPVAPLGLLVAVETLPDIVRTLGNVMWDLATTATLARWQGDDQTELTS